MADRAEDKQLGISIRFIKQFDVKTDADPSRFDAFTSDLDAAFILAIRDKREGLTFGQKMDDALEFIRTRPIEPLEL